MDISGAEAAWLKALRELTASRAAAAAWRANRTRFAYALGAELRAANDLTAPGLSLIYAVWLDLGCIYIGQSTSGRRRMADLPMGESHHLANTFPPELWTKVMVVPWPRFDAPTAAARNSVTKQFNDEIAKARYTSVEPDRIVGLGIEYVLTTQVRPVFNVTEKRAGVLGERMNVNALGRRAAELESVKAIAGLVLSAWLEADAATEGGPIADGRGSVVFPQHLRAKLAAQLGASEQTPDSDAAREELSSLASRDDAGIRSGSVEAAHADAPSRNLRS